MYATIADIRAYLDQVPELAQQRITLTGATGGTFTLSYNGETTAPLAFNASGAAVRAAMVALPTLTGAALNVAGRRAGPWVVTFPAAIGNSADEITIATGGLTGSGISATVVPATDALLAACISRATGWIDTLLDPIRFAAYPAADDRLVNGLGGTVLPLPPHEIGSVSAVDLDGTTMTDWEERSDGALYRESGWAVTAPLRDWVPVGPLSHHTYGWDNQRSVRVPYRVTARWGYGPAPTSIQELCLELAVNIWRGRDRGLWTETIGASDGANLRYIGGINRTQQAIIDAVKNQYREVVV